MNSGKQVIEVDPICTHPGCKKQAILILHVRGVDMHDEGHWWHHVPKMWTDGPVAELRACHEHLPTNVLVHTRRLLINTPAMGGADVDPVPPG